ncbi:hypothetical protein ACH4UV_38485 [Streptomyces sp. NPDC020802]|uniref:hypothetical protein n=1 Tax=Streptomyces sp. NPDC020802 TaxID=3365094 RepID=UPI00378CB868
MSILTGFQEPDTGTLRFSGEPAPAFEDINAWRSRVARVMENPCRIGGAKGHQAAAAFTKLFRWDGVRPLPGVAGECRSPSEPGRG